MNDLERQLRQTLARRDPSPEFRTRVLGRVSPRPSWPRWAAAAAVLATVFAGVEYRQWRQGQAAKEQLVMALDIAARKLALVEKKISEGSNLR